MMVLALVGGGAVLTGAAAAQAAPLPDHTFTFVEPKGSDWVVPGGVTEVIVGLRGGTGGCHYCSQPGGLGKSYLLKLEVSPGDTLTVYVGQSAADYSRGAGKGFIDGGKGGDKSRSAGVGNGGGGAAALKLNGELLAVAGGGGGGGGNGGDREIRPFSYSADFGGAGGDANTGTQPAWGEGKHAGNPGKNGENAPSFSRYNKSGENGASAGFMTSGGGGGAGGGGWPASGTAGGAGKKKLGFGAGSGGGAGMSWINPDASQLTVIDDGSYPVLEFGYTGPLAVENTAKITIPLELDTALYGPQEVAVGQDFELRAVSRDAVLQGLPIDGSFRLEVDGAQIAIGKTDGDITIPVAGLDEGTHTFSYVFTAKHSMGQYWNDNAVQRVELTVIVSATRSEGAGQDYLDLPPDSQGAEEESDDQICPAREAFEDVIDEG